MIQLHFEMSEFVWVFNLINKSKAKSDIQTYGQVHFMEYVQCSHKAIWLDFDVDDSELNWELSPGFRIFKQFGCS